MNDAEKINQIGRMIADLNLEVSILKRYIVEIRKWMLFPDKLKVAIEVEKIMQKNDKESKGGK